MFNSHTKITGFGAYVPEKVLSNADLEKIVDTNDEWIRQRTGMRERRICEKDVFASDLGIKAVENLVEAGGKDIQDVDMLIVTTFTPDHFTPTVSGLIQGHFNIRNCGTFDLAAGCTGFNYALFVADSMITCGRARKVLVVSAETLSKVVDYTDRTSCILFGDASVACMLERTEGPGSFYGAYFSSDGDLADNVTCGNLSMSVLGKQLKTRGIFDQNGQQVYKYVVQNVPVGVGHLLEQAEMTLDQIDWFVPHSANLRIIQSVCDKLPMPREKMLTSLEYHGNTSSATIPLAIWLAKNEGKLKDGDLALLYGFGGGLTHGGVLVRL